MEKKLIEEISRINGLMKVNEEMFSDLKILEENTLLMESTRKEIFERFFRVVFSDSGDNIIRNVDEGFSVLQKQADELVAAQKMTKQQADDAMSMVKKYIDDLKMASGDVNKFVDNLPRRGAPEAIHYKVNMKKFLNLLDDVAVSKMRRQIFTNMRGTPQYIEAAQKYQNEIMSSLVAEYEQRAGAGGFKVTRDQVKNQFANKMKLLDQKTNRTMWSKTPEFYDDVAEYSQKAVDDFFNGVGYNGMGAKILKKTPAEVFSSYKTIDDVEPLTDDEIKYLNDSFETKNGFAGNLRLKISDLYSNIKGYKKEYSELIEDTIKQISALEKGQVDEYTRQVIMEKIAENLKKLPEKNQAMKAALVDWVEKNISDDNLKNVLLTNPDEAVERIGVINSSTVDNVASDGTTTETTLDNQETWRTWWREAQTEASLGRKRIFSTAQGFATDIVKKSVPLTAKQAQTIAERVGLMKKIGDDLTDKNSWGVFWEWFSNGTAGLDRSEFGSRMRFVLPAGLEAVWTLLGKINLRLVGAQTQRQVNKRLVKLGSHYLYSFMFWGWRLAVAETILDLILYGLSNTGVWETLKDNQKIGGFLQQQLNEFDTNTRNVCFFDNQCVNLFSLQEKPNIGYTTLLLFVNNMIYNYFGKFFSGQAYSTITAFTPGYLDNLLLSISKIPTYSQVVIEIENEKKKLDNTSNEQIQVIKKDDENKITQVLDDAENQKKGKTREWLQRLISKEGWDLAPFYQHLQYDPNTKGGENGSILKKTGMSVWAANIPMGTIIFNKPVPSNDLYYLFKMTNDLNNAEYKIVTETILTSPQIWENFESGWKQVPRNIVGDVNKTTQNESIYNKRNKLIMERKTRRIFEEKDEKFGEEKFEHWKKTFEFSSQDPETKEWKRIEKETIESKQVEIEKWVDHYLKSNDEDDAFVRSVIHVFKLDKNPKNHVKKVSFNKGLAHLSENFEVGGLLRVVSLIRESKELEIWSVKYYADGNWELVKGSFNDEELKNVGKTVRERDKKEEERKKPVEGLKKKELTGIQLLNQDEKQGLTELPKQVQRKLLEKLRNGWVTEKPYEFFNEFYSVSNINTIFNEKLKIYKLNPSKEFFNSLVKNSPRIFPRKGICKALSGVENDENINERTKIVLNHILQKCQTKFKGEYGVKQIKTN